MRNYVQVSIPEKLYNVILALCKLEPGVETDRRQPEDYIEQCLASEIADYIANHFYDEETLKIISPVVYANIVYKEEWWKEQKEKYPDNGFVCMWDAIFPDKEENTK